MVFVQKGFPCASDGNALKGAQMLKNSPAIQETQVQSLVQKDPWRRKWQPTPVFLPGEIPWTEEPGGLQSMGSHRVGHD